MENTGGRFRKKRTNFSMVSNNIIRDANISLKAKGLYALIQSYITIEDFILYKGFLQSRCCEGKKAFESAWKELKDTGYLVQYRMQDEKHQFYYEYELLDVVESPVPQNGDAAYFPIPPNGYTGKGVLSEKDDTQNGDDKSNTNKKNILISNILSNHIISADDVKRQIDYECYCKSDMAQVDNLVMIMVDVLNMDDAETIRVNQRTLTAEIVKNRFRQINHSHIDYILLVLRDFTGKISNTRNFLITTIYNAPSTIDVYYSNRVMHDMYGT